MGYWGAASTSQRQQRQSAGPVRLAGFDGESTLTPARKLLAVALVEPACEQEVTTSYEEVTAMRWRPSGSGIKLHLVIGALAAGGGAILVSQGGADNDVLGGLTFGIAGVMLGRAVASAIPRSRTRLTPGGGAATEGVACGDQIAPERFTLVTPWGTRSRGKPACRGEFCLPAVRGDFLFEFDSSALLNVPAPQRPQRVFGTGAWSVIHDSGIQIQFPISEASAAEIAQGIY